MVQPLSKIILAAVNVRSWQFRSLFEGMFAFRCQREGAYSQAVGIALDARRLDQVEEIVQQSGHSRTLIEYVIHVTQNLVVNRAFRESVSCSMPPY